MRFQVVFALLAVTSLLLHADHDRITPSGRPFADSLPEGEPVMIFIDETDLGIGESTPFTRPMVFIHCKVEALRYSIGSGEPLIVEKHLLFETTETRPASSKEQLRVRMHEVGEECLALAKEKMKKLEERFPENIFDLFLTVSANYVTK